MYDRIRERIMFPIRDTDGHVAGFAGRTLNPDKYLNTPATDLYNKSRLLFGLSKAKNDIARTGEAVIVEGYTDAIAAHRNGIGNAVAGGGIAFTQHHTTELLNVAATEVTIMFDGDTAGRAAARKAGARCAASGLPVTVVDLPAGKDPADMTAANLQDAYHNPLPHLWSEIRSAAGQCNFADPTQVIQAITEILARAGGDHTLELIAAHQTAALLSVPLDTTLEILERDYPQHATGRTIPPPQTAVGLTRGRHTNLVVGHGSIDEVAELAQAATTRPDRHLPAISHGPAQNRDHQTDRHPPDENYYDDEHPHDIGHDHQAPPEPAPAPQEPTPDTTEHDIKDEQDDDPYAPAVLAEAQLAHEEQEPITQEEEAAAAEAEKKAAITVAVKQWVQDLPDGLPTEQVAADAEQQWWGPAVRAAAVAGHYQSEQTTTARRWVQNELAGWEAGWVADSAREKFTVGDDSDGLLEEAYQAAANQRLDAGDGWLAEHGNRRDDDQQEDRRAEAVAQFGIVPEYAEQMVDYYDTRQRAAAVASVENLTKNRSAAQALPEIVKRWVGTRYLDDALDALQKQRQAQEQKTPQRRRGGPSLGW